MAFQDGKNRGGKVALGTPRPLGTLSHARRVREPANNVPGGREAVVLHVISAAPVALLSATEERGRHDGRVAPLADQDREFVQDSEGTS